MTRKTYTKDEMAAFAELMSEAVGSSEGMVALAAAIAPPVMETIKTREIASLLLTEDLLPVGETPKYQIVPEARAFWISLNGEARECEMGVDEVEPSILRVHTYPTIRKDTLKHGNVGSLMEMQDNAGIALQKQIDQHTVNVISAAVPAANIITLTGASLTEAALNQAFSILEDLELTPKKVVMRGARFNDIREWNSLDNITQNELRVKGILKNWGTADIITSSAAAMTEVLVLPDEEIGKMPVRETLIVEPDNIVKEFKIGFLMHSDRGFVVTRPQHCVKILITG